MKRGEGEFVVKAAVMDRISIAHLCWKRYVQGLLQPYGVTPKQLFLLRRLEHTEYLLPSEVARLVFSDRPTATVIIRNMEKRGWIAVHTDPDNRRQKRITITPQGKAKLDEVPESCFSIGATELDPYHDLSHEELQTLNRLLGQVVRRLRKASSNTVTHAERKRRA